MKTNLTLFALLMIAASCVSGEANASTLPEDAAAQLGVQVQRNLEAGTRTVASTRNRLKEENPEEIAVYRVKVLAVRAAERGVRQTLQTLQKTSEAEWPRARAALAASYDVFTEAVADVERFVERGSSSTEGDT